MNVYRLLPILFACLMLSEAAPASEDAQARITSYKNNNDGAGNYEFSYETSNGISRSERGRLVNVGQPDEHIVVEGEYSYIDPDGMAHVVRYEANENGYRELPPVLVKPVGNRIFAANPALVASLLG